MDQTLHFLSENVLNLMRGAQLMLFVAMCVNLYPKRKKNPILNHFFWLLIVMMVFLLSSLGLMIDSLRNSYLFEDFKILTDFLLVPLVGSYLLKVMLPELINVRRVLLLLSPNIVLALIHAYTQSSVVFTMALIYSLSIGILIFVFIVLISRHYNRYLKKVFSEIDNKTVDWVRVITCVFALWYIVWGVVVDIDNRWIDSTYYLFLITLWIFIYFYSVKHIIAVKAQDLFEKFPSKTKDTIQSGINKQVHTETSMDLVGQKLQVYIDKYHPWLNPSLTLQDLATALGTNRTYLSEYLNKELNITFYDYINGFRIRYACELLLSDREGQLANIGERSGFNSLSTFRRAFEKHKGTTPAKYRNCGDN